VASRLHSSARAIRRTVIDTVAVNTC
jgi:hypothetical protein